ncbi:MAG TPA: o-succinylbenzoate synthase [Acidimicrobiia bacterium]|jgi:O-succinylbenzoate synthase|nr:o-succinylbenzoate synthase [Acidimicrobiia bacterium]
MREALEALELHPVRIPMRQRFRRVDHREAVLVRGPRGWGEFSPFPDYPPEVTTRWLAAALELACGDLPEPLRTSIPVNVTIPAVDPDTATALVIESGAKTAKVKIGDPRDSADDDFARVAAVRECLGPEGKVRVDVNAGWDLETAVSRLERLSELNLQYVEQPVSTIEEMRTLRSRVPVPVAADELVRQSPHPLRVIEEGAADILILKVQPMGGVSRVLDLANRAGIPMVISSALETSVGMYGGLLAASLLPELPYACGLGTVALLEGDPTLDPLVPDDGVLQVRRPEPDPQLLDRWRPERDRGAEMLRKLRAAAAVLT